MYERDVLLIESKQRVNEMSIEFYKPNRQTNKIWNCFKYSSGNFSNKRLNISNNTLKLVQTCDFNLIKKSKSGTFPFKYEDFAMMINIAKNTV